MVIISKLTTYSNSNKSAEEQQIVGNNSPSEMCIYQLVATVYTITVQPDHDALHIYTHAGQLGSRLILPTLLLRTLLI